MNLKCLPLLWVLLGYAIGCVISYVFGSPEPWALVSVLVMVGAVWVVFFVGTLKLGQNK